MYNAKMNSHPDTSPYIIQLMEVTWLSFYLYFQTILLNVCQIHIPMICVELCANYIIVIFVHIVHIISQLLVVQIHYMAILRVRFPLYNTKALLGIHTTVAIQVGEGHIIMSRGHCAWDIHVMHSSQVESVQVSSPYFGNSLK